MLPGPIDGHSGHWDPASPRVGISNTHCRARHTVGVREVWADGHMEGIQRCQHSYFTDAETEVQRSEVTSPKSQLLSDQAGI